MKRVMIILNRAIVLALFGSIFSAFYNQLLDKKYYNSGIDTKTDRDVYLTVIKEIRPPKVKTILVVDTTTKFFKPLNAIGADMQEKFNRDFLFELMNDWNTKNDSQIHITIDILKQSDSIFSWNSNSVKNYNNYESYVFSFSRIGYSKNKRFAVLYVEYNKLAGNEGGSSIIILENFWDKWRLIHLSELSVY